MSIISSSTGARVGIITSTPEEALTVQGKISGSGGIYLGGENGTIHSFVSASTLTSTSASIHTSASYSDIRFENLPTAEPTTSGSLWLSGSTTAGKSKYLVVFNG